MGAIASVVSEVVHTVRCITTRGVDEYSSVDVEVSEPMLDRQINAVCVLAYALWIASLALWGIGWAVDLPPIRALSIIVCAMAGTATIRTYFIEQHERFKAALTMTSYVQSGEVRTLHR